MQKILIIEDDQNILLALTVRLEHAGYEVMFEQTVPGAIRRIKQGKLTPDLVLLDIMLPGGTGLDVAEQLRSERTTREVPIVVITASRAPNLRERAEHLAASAFFEKPYDSSSLMKAVRDLLSRDPAIEIFAG